jgi:hypothetical protein
VAGDGEYYRIDVRTRRSGLRVSARAGFLNFTSEELDEREVLGSYLVPEMFDAIPLQAEVVPLERHGGAWYAIAQVQLPISALEWLPQGDATAGQIEIGTTLFRANTMTGRFNRALTLRFPAGASPRDAAHVIFQQPFRLKPGSYVGITVARDGVTGERGGSRIEFEIPRGERDALHLVVGRLPGADILSLPLEEVKSDFARKTVAPALDRKLVWGIPGQAHFVPDDVIVVAYLLPDAAASPPTVSHRLFRGTVEVPLDQRPALGFTGEKSEHVSVYQDIRAGELGPGSYSIEVHVGEGELARSAELAFEIAPYPTVSTEGIPEITLSEP